MIVSMNTVAFRGIFMRLVYRLVFSEDQIDRNFRAVRFREELEWREPDETNVRASTVDTTIVVISMLGRALMKSPFAPESSSSGEKVNTIANVEAMTEGATSFTPLYSMLSLTTIESSTSIPSAMIKPMTDIWFRSTPNHGRRIYPLAFSDTVDGVLFIFTKLKHSQMGIMAACMHHTNDRRHHFHEL